jgi:hypothetical protein
MLQELLFGSLGIHRNLTFELFNKLDIPDLINIGKVSKNCASDKQRIDILNSKISLHLKNNIHNHHSINDLIDILPKSSKILSIHYYSKFIQNINYPSIIPILSISYGNIPDCINIFNNLIQKYNPITNDNDDVIYIIQSSIHEIFDHIPNDKIIKLNILHFLIEINDVYSHKSIILSYLDEIYDIYGIHDIIDNHKISKFIDLIHYYDSELYLTCCYYIKSRFELYP